MSDIVRDIVMVFFGSFDRAAAGLAGLGQRLAKESGGTLRAVEVDPSEYHPEGCLARLVDACRGARAILLSNDTYSQELAPRLAYRLGGSCAGDGVDVAFDGALERAPHEQTIRVTRQVYGGKAQAVIALKRTPGVAWLRARSFAAGELPADVTHVSGAGHRPADLPAERRHTEVAGPRVVERKTQAQTEARLEDARVIVSGGRGIGGPEGFANELQPLAALLGAQMAASRAACDAGWVPPTWQVGQTGKKVAPDLYLAIAITGASQHMAGISEARNIAAINIDPDAPIFRHCRFGIVEDYRNVVPRLREKLEELQR